MSRQEYADEIARRDEIRFEARRQLAKAVAGAQREAEAAARLELALWAGSR